MNTQLSQTQIQNYRENGFIVLPDFLTPAELQEWREAVDDAVSARGNLRIPGHDADAAAGCYGKVFKQRVNLWQTNDKIKHIMLDERLGKMAADLAGVEGIRIWHDQALIKMPWANPTGWHLDVPNFSFDSRDCITIWVALDDATVENGCLFFLPRTHKTGRLDNSGIGQNSADLFDVYTEWRAFHSVAATMRAGSCSFHNGLTAHGASANMTPGLRRAMTCAYMPDGSRFNGKQNVLRKEQVARLKVGDLLDDERQNPLIYSRSMTTKNVLQESRV